MDTLSINDIMMRDPYTSLVYGGTWSIDTLPLNNKGPICYILNASPSTDPGSHWTALYMDNGLTEHFCSYGMEPPLKLKNMTYNNRKIQSTTSDLCGEYCILYLMCRCGGYSLQNYLECFSHDTEVNDEIVRMTVYSTL